MFKKFKDTRVFNRHKNLYYCLGMARKLKYWEDEKWKIHYHSYLLEDGSVIVYEEEWTNYGVDTKLEKYESIEEYEDAYFPKPKEITVEEYFGE